MKNLTPLLLIFILTSCGNIKHEENGLCVDTLFINKTSVCLNSISKDYFDSTKSHLLTQSDKIPIDTTVIKITSSEILIKTKGDPIRFKNDTTDCETSAKYQYQTTYTFPKYIHIKGIFWEWTMDFLVNFTSGEIDTLWGSPLFSPHKDLIIAYSADESGEMPNGIECLRIENNSAKVIFEKKISSWRPSEIKWESDSTILIKRTKIDNNDQQNVDYLRMKIK